MNTLNELIDAWTAHGAKAVELTRQAGIEHNLAAAAKNKIAESIKAAKTESVYHQGRVYTAKDGQLLIMTARTSEDLTILSDFAFKKGNT